MREEEHSYARRRSLSERSHAFIELASFQRFARR